MGDTCNSGRCWICELRPKLSVRAGNALHLGPRGPDGQHHGFTGPHEVSARRLFSIKRVGRKTVAEIREAFRLAGLPFEDLPHVPPAEVERLRMERRNQRKERRERAEYERLKKKFEGV